MKINSLVLKPELSREACQELICTEFKPTGQKSGGVAVGTEKLSHNCGGSLAYTEMFRLFSAQLQSIKKAVNTYKVSFTTPTTNRNAEEEPRNQWAALYNSTLQRWLKCCAISLKMPPPRVCRTLPATSITEVITLRLRKVLVNTNRCCFRGTAQ